MKIVSPEAMRSEPHDSHLDRANAPRPVDVCPDCKEKMVDVGMNGVPHTPVWVCQHCCPHDAKDHSICMECGKDCFQDDVGAAEFAADCAQDR
jgi:hypothetical protein